MNWFQRNTVGCAVASVLGVAGLTLAAILLFGTAPAPVNPPPEAAPPPAGERHFGWVDQPEDVAQVVASLPIKEFQDTPAFAAMGDPPDHAYLWEAAKKVRGSHVPTRDQGSIGACVAFGSACAIEYVECVQLATAAARKSAFRDISQEVIYGGSRVQIGGGKIKGDGSVGAWAAQWSQKYGVVARGEYASVDLSTYSVERCRQYGNAGCPAALVPVAKSTPIKSITQVKTADELRKALASGYPVTVASNVGFGQQGPYTRDRDGFLKASGSWPHQMCFIGFRTDIPGFYCMNSWGTSWVTGPAGPGDPPPGGFWVHESTASKMLSQNDSWAYSDLVGFTPRRPLDWSCRPQQRRDWFAVQHPFGDRTCELSYSLSP